MEKQNKTKTKQKKAKNKTKQNKQKNNKTKTKQKKAMCIRESGSCPKTQQPTLKQHSKGYTHKDSGGMRC